MPAQLSGGGFGGGVSDEEAERIREEAQEELRRQVKT